VCISGCRGSPLKRWTCSRCWASSFWWVPVVNNAILIVHQSLNHLRFDGLSANESILQAISTRIRPIFMTTTTTVFGLAPLVLFPGAGSELYRGLGSVVLGGLLVSTIFTLVLVPTLFSLALEGRERMLERSPKRV